MKMKDGYIRSVSVSERKSKRVTSIGIHVVILYQLRVVAAMSLCFVFHSSCCPDSIRIMLYHLYEPSKDELPVWSCRGMFHLANVDNVTDMQRDDEMTSTTNRGPCPLADV